MTAISWGLYLILAAINILAFVFVRYCLVETRGKTLEEMSSLFGIEEKQSSGEGSRSSERRGTRTLYFPGSGWFLSADIQTELLREDPVDEVEDEP